MKQRVAIIAALPREIASLVNGWQSDETLAARKIFVYWAEDAIVACAGMGARRVALALEAALAKGPVSEIVSVGWAGGLHAGIQEGSLHVPGLVIDALTGERFGTGEGKAILVTVGAVAGPAEKQRLRETYGADLVDMEAATVARMAQARGIPFRALKAVSDAHDFDMPGMARFSTSDGEFREGAFALHVLLRPAMWSKVARMANMSRVSAVNLCRMLRAQLDGMKKLNV